MTDTRLEVTYAFWNAEVHLWREGPCACFRMMRKGLRAKLEAAGGFGPFRLTIRRGDGRVSPHVLVMWEAY